MKHFSSRRGRPPLGRPKRDLGTPELAFKRAHGITTEPLDLCHQRGLIDDKLHWSGVHFRWLYTLRYGTADPTAIRLDKQLDTGAPAQDDPAWREAREQELSDAINALGATQLYPVIRDLCVHHAMPNFLSPALCIKAFEQHDARLAQLLERELYNVRDGLETLTLLWKKPPQRPAH